MVDDINRWTAPIRRPCQAPDKIGLIVRIMETLAAYYEVEDYLETWAKTMAAREALADSSVRDHVAMPSGFQQTGLVRTDSAQADWWLFMFPEGYATWESSADQDADPLHLMLFKVLANPKANGPPSDVIVRSRLLFEMAVRQTNWIEVSKSSEADAARLFGGMIVRANRRLNE